MTKNDIVYVFLFIIYPERAKRSEDAWITKILRQSRKILAKTRKGSKNSKILKLLKHSKKFICVMNISLSYHLHRLYHYIQVISLYTSYIIIYKLYYLYKLYHLYYLFIYKPHTHSPFGLIRFPIFTLYYKFFILYLLI